MDALTNWAIAVQPWLDLVVLLGVQGYIAWRFMGWTLLDRDEAGRLSRRAERLRLLFAVIVVALLYESTYERVMCS